jgi:hypothetical protein
MASQQSDSTLLKPISGLQFNSDLHRYRYNGRWLPFSVSRITNRTTPEQEAQFERTKHIWAPRGTTIHAFCEAMLLGEELPETDYTAWTDELQECWLLRDSDALAVEYRLCDARKGVGGSFDFLLRTSNGKIVLGDLKTVGSNSGVSQRKPATAQLGGYLAMLIDHHPMVTVDWCYTVVVGPGRCRVIQSEPDECLGAWVDAWDAFKVHSCPF